jgi:cytochrome P450
MKATRFHGRGPTLIEDVFHFVRLLRNYTDEDCRIFRDYGDIVKTRLPHRFIYFFHPRHVKHILRDNVRNYPKSRQYELLRPLLGQGLFVSDGELWTRQRRMMAPEFRENAVGRFIPIMAEAAESLFAEWDRKLQSQPINVSDDMMRLTLWIVGGALFRQDFRERADLIGRSLAICLEHATLQMMSSASTRAGYLRPAIGAPSAQRRS